MRRFSYVLLIAGLSTSPLAAAPVDDLMAALKIPALIEILAAEGRSDGDDLAAELFPGADRTGWRAIIARLHAPEALMGQARANLEKAFAGQEAAAAEILAFATSERGSRIFDLEVAAREAYVDEGVKEAAKQAFEAMVAREDARLPVIERLVDANDLIEQNIAGALNSNLAFYKGMIAGGGIEGGLPEDDMMADLWSQEPQIREDTVNWLMPYLSMAYQPVSEADLQAYADFSESMAGQRLNTALFSTFETIFEGLAFEIGQAAATYMKGQDI